MCFMLVNVQYHHGSFEQKQLQLIKSDEIIIKTILNNAEIASKIYTNQLYFQEVLRSRGITNKIPKSIFTPPTY